MRQKSVVITGASTGIGEATALYLDERGYQVFAGVRQQEDAVRLQGKASTRLIPLFLDVTDAEMIRAALQSVSDAVGDAGLRGLINNAGISLGGPVEFLPLENLRQVLEVNAVGPVAVTQAFIPLLRRAGGRVINIGSAMGQVALPLASPYAMSKFALEAFTDSLRREVRQWGIEVSIIDPGHIKTPIWQKADKRIGSHRHEWPPELEAFYGKNIDEMAIYVAESAQRGLPPQAVATVVHKALTANRPRTRYLVGNDAHLVVFLNRLLSDRIMDYLLQRVMKSG